MRIFSTFAAEYSVLTMSDLKMFVSPEVFNKLIDGLNIHIGQQAYGNIVLRGGCR